LLLLAFACCSEALQDLRREAIVVPGAARPIGFRPDDDRTEVHHRAQVLPRSRDGDLQLLRDVVDVLLSTSQGCDDLLPLGREQGEQRWLGHWKYWTTTVVRSSTSGFARSWVS